MKSRLFFGMLLFSIITMSVGSSCEKKTDCGVTITVQNASGVPLSGATVELSTTVKNPQPPYGTVDADLKTNGVTDANGKVTFTFKLPAVLDVKAELEGKGGTGIIKLEIGEKIEKVIIII